MNKQESPAITIVRKVLSATALLGAGLMGVSAAAQAPVVVPSNPAGSFFFFGDSLSDTGNAFGLSGGTNPESPPYFLGRFSNGPIWVELLPQLQGVPVSAAPSFAVGGAETGTGGSVGVATQIQSFIDGGGSVPSNTIVSVFAGANDILNNAASTEPTELVARIVSDTVTNISTLAAVGGQRFLVPNVPRLGITPVGQSSGAASDLTSLSILVNSAVFDAMAELEQALGVEVIIADTDALFLDFIADTETYGFTNTDVPCLSATGTDSPTGACETEEQEAATLFFDPLHPTAPAHAFFAEYINGMLVANDQGPRIMAAIGELGLIVTESLHNVADQRLYGLRSGFGTVVADHARVDLGKDRIAGFIAGGFNFGERRNQPDRASFDYDHFRVSAGIEYEADQNLLGGVAVTYLDGDIEFENDLARANNDSFGVTAYGTARIGRLYLDAALGFSLDDYEQVERATGNGVTPESTGDTEGNTFFASLETGYRLDVQAVTFAPFAGVRFLNAEIDGYTENAPALNAITVGDMTADRYLIEGGLSVSGAFEGNSFMWVPHIRLSVEHAFTDSDLDFDFQVAGDLPRPITAENDDDTALRFGGGMMVSHGGGFDVVFDYDGSFGDDSVDHRVSMRARKRF